LIIAMIAASLRGAILYSNARKRCAVLRRKRSLSIIAIGLLLAAGQLLHVIADERKDEADGARIDVYGDPLPPNAASRLGTIRFRQGGYSLTAVSFLPDYKTVLTAGETLKFWETDTGRPLREIRTDPMSVQAFALSRDGKKIAVAGFWYPDDRTQGPKGELRILDAATGEVLKTVPQESRDVNRAALEFSPDGKLLFSLGNNGVLRIEELASGAEILQHKFQGDNSPFLSLSPDGKSLAVVAGPNVRKFHLWQWQTGEEPQELKTVAANDGGGQLVFSPDGRQVAWAGTNDDPLHVWDVATRKLVARLPLPAQDEAFVGTLLFTPDGKRLLAPSGRHRQGRLHCWNAATWKYERRLDISAARFTISADSRLLTTGIRVYNLQTGQEIGGIDDAHREHISRILATAGGRAITGSDDGSIRIWDLATSRQERKLLHDYWVRDIAVSPDGSRLVSSGLDDSVRLWNLSDSKEIYRLPGHGRLGGRRAVAFMNDGKSFASFGDDFYLYIWDVRTGKAIAEHKLQPTGVKVPEENDERDQMEVLFLIEGARFSPGGKYLVLGGQRKLHVFDVASGKELRVWEREGGGSLTRMEVSPDERHLLTSSWGKQIQVKLPDGRTQYTTEKEDILTLWNLETRERVKEFKLKEGAGAIAFSCDGRQFAVATNRPNSKVAIYDLGGVQQQVVEGIPNRVSSLGFTPDGKLIVGLDNSSALVYDLKRLRKE
jgi:WD40 repeat protein